MRHRLLQRQLERATRDGTVDVDRLAALVSEAYVEADAERARTDISSRVMSEELMKLHEMSTAEASSRVRAILDAVGEGVVIVARDGTIEAINRAAEALFAIAADDARGTAASALGLDANGELGTALATAVRKDGSTFAAELTRSEVYLDRRTVRVIILRDVSERNEQRSRLEEAISKAEAASRAKSDFLATMSHEIRTPMNGVIGMVGLLLDTALNPTQQAYATTIRDSADALLVLINDILDFSKIEARTVELEVLDFALVPLVESVIELLAPRAHAKGIEIAAFVAKDVPRHIRGDAGRLRQVLTNFVGNGIKFTDRGEVSLEVSIEVDSEGARRVRFEVVDTGPGISDADKAKLFQEFVQVDSSSTRKHGGTGLGLAISRRIIEAMNGEVGIRDSDGGGSTFFAVMPFEESTAVSDPPRLGLERRVLVIDDNATNRRIFERQLGNMGFRVEAVESGDMALAAIVKAAFGNDPFHVAVVDHQMPGMSGDVFARTLKAIPTFAQIPLILASSGGAEAVRSSDAAPFFSTILTKPVRQAALREAIATCIGEDAVRPAPVAPVVVEREGRKLRVLVVDDNHVNTLVASGYLERAGHRVDCAASGREAVDAVTSFPYDVVLMDVHMPDLDGLAATALVRSLPSKRARTPIIALTASAMREDREACLAAGMDDFLPKPFERSALLAMVERWGESGATAAGPPAAEESLPATGDAAFWRMVDDLCEVGAHDVYAKFATEARRDAADLRESAKIADYGRIAATAHRLRGAAGTLALGVIAALATRLEAAGKARTEESLPLAADLARHADATAGFLEGPAFAAALARARAKTLRTGS